MERKPQKKNKRLRAAAVIFTVCAIAAGIVLYAQDCKLRDIEAEQRALLEEISDQENEKNRLEYMIEYSENKDYLIQYAREKLGYIKPDEIKFDMGK